MADAYWMQLGGNLAFALEVGGQIVGIVYWLDPGGVDENQPPEGFELPETGWYFVSTNLPRHPERVARGHELRSDMGEEGLAETVTRALEEVANEVLADEAESG